jgi:hypothetical protein
LAPMCIEVKEGSQQAGHFVLDDWAVIEQLILRVRMQIGCYAFLCCSLALGVAGHNAYLVVMDRAVDRSKHVSCLHIIRIKRGSVLPMWHAVHDKSRREPGWFFMEGGCMLLRAMEHAGVDPWAHVSKLLAFSMSKVYSVLEPDAHETPVLAIKVITKRNDSEVPCAGLLFPKLQQLYPKPFYCVLALQG